MRFSPGAVLNLVCWAALAGLGLASVLIANRLGFVGLALLGLFTWLVCSMAAMDEDAPTYGIAVFRSRFGAAGSPEQRAAADAARQGFLSPLRFYRWCGIVLVVIGGAGFVWQSLQ